MTQIKKDQRSSAFISVLFPENRRFPAFGRMTSSIKLIQLRRAAVDDLVHRFFGCLPQAFNPPGDPGLLPGQERFFLLRRVQVLGTAVHDNVKRRGEAAVGFHEPFHLAYVGGGKLFELAVFTQLFWQQTITLESGGF